MKDNKRKIYHLFICAQICILIAVCVLPVLGQIKQAAESVISGNESVDESGKNDGESNDVSGDNEDDPALNTDEEDLNQINMADYAKVIENASPEIRNKLENMSLEEKAAQLFIISPEALTNSVGVNAAGKKTKEAIEQYPVGGLFYSAENLLYNGQVKTMTQSTQEYSKARIGLPMFIGVAEEGGKHSPFAGNINFDLKADDLATIAATNNPAKAETAGRKIGDYLTTLGINFTLGPVADITYLDNSATAGTTFGSDPAMVSDMTKAYVKALQEKGVSAVLKYFPGKGYAPKTTEDKYPISTMELSGFEEQFQVYKNAIAAGADFVMVGHILPKGAEQGGELASMSATVIEKKLRGELGFNGLVITEALNGKNITNDFSSAEAAVNVFKAGADMIFLPENFEEAYNGLIQAVKDGAITEERLNASIVRVLKEKIQ